MLIKRSGITRKMFAENIGMSYSTLLTILRNGIETASFENVVKICDGLGVPIEIMRQDYIKPNPLEYLKNAGLLLGECGEEAIQEYQKMLEYIIFKHCNKKEEIIEEQDESDDDNTIYLKTTVDGKDIQKGKIDDSPAMKGVLEQAQKLKEEYAKAQLAGKLSSGSIRAASVIAPPRKLE